MDYKEKYEALLEKAREIMNNECSSDQTKTICQEFFPELRESEDEKIRKNILGLVKKHAVNHERVQMEDWLEKRKEQKPVSALDRGDEIILKAICEELKDAPGWVERIEGWYRLAKDAQQHAEWSDEDEKMLHIVITDINYAQRHFSDSKLVPYGKKVDWLRAFRERFKSLKPQPTQEWSDEDEEMINALIRNQEILIDSTSVEQLRDIYSKEIQWLKSRRSPSSWKPTEEQIEALECAERWYSDNMGCNSHLWQLLCDRKKL